MRATHAIAVGSEITSNYLGPGVALPVAQRQEALQGAYGFACGCPRCKVEADAGEGVASALQAAHDWVAAGEPQAAARLASQTGKAEELAAIRDKAKELTAALEAAAEAASVPPALQIWLKASAYAAYELLAVCNDSEGDGTDPAVPEALLPLAEVWGRGSDAHIFLAADAFNRAQAKHGPQSDQSLAALKRFLNSLVLRYGRVSDSVMQRIITDRLSIEHHLGRYNLIRV